MQFHNTLDRILKDNQSLVDNIQMVNVWMPPQNHNGLDLLWLATKLPISYIDLKINFSHSCSNGALSDMHFRGNFSSFPN